MIHLRTETNRANDQYKSLCGDQNLNSTNNPAFVTCKKCLFIMNEIEIEIKPAPYEFNWIIDRKIKAKNV